MSRRSINIAVVLGIIALLVAIIIIGEANNVFLYPTIRNEEQSADDNLIVVGVAQLGSESVWRTANTNSVQDALVRENGFFLIMNNARQNQDNQIKAVRNFISQGVDYIVIAPAKETGWDTVLDEAKAAGIPVILMDRNVDVKDKTSYVTHVGSDMVEEGRKAGAWLEEQFPNPEEQINIVILQGTLGSSAQIGREEGFFSVANKHDNWNILEIANADFTTSKGKEEMARLLRQYEKIDVVVSENDDMTFGAVEAIKEAGRSVGVGQEITMISFDACYDALTMVYNGDINIDIECNPLLGEPIAEIIHKLEAGEKVSKEYPIEEQVFTKENVEEALPNRTY